jgi:UDP-glucuronate decarboxylase
MCATTDASVGKCKSLYKSDFEAFFRQLAFPIVRKRVEKMLRMLLSSNGRRDDLSQTEKFAAKPPAKLWSSWRQPMEYMLKEQRLIFVVLGMAIASAFFLLQTEFLLSDQMISEQDSPSIIVGRGLIVPGEPGIRRDNSIQVRRRSTTVVPKQSSFTAKMPLGLKRKVLRVVVTGGAGFVGSHLVDKLMARGDHVIVVDNFFTGRKENVMHHFGNHRFELIRHDVVEPLLLEVDQIYHLACPASPVHYKHNPVKTIISFSHSFPPFLVKSFEPDHSQRKHCKSTTHCLPQWSTMLVS